MPLTQLSLNYMYNVNKNFWKFKLTAKNLIVLNIKLIKYIIFFNCSSK